MFCSGAVISADERYRYALWRRDDKPGFQPGNLLCVVGVNPSTADAEKDDATIRKCTKFARRLGYGGLLMVNVHAWRSRDPKSMLAQKKAGADVDGPENFLWLRAAFMDAGMIVCAWGRNADPLRAASVASIATHGEFKNLYAFRLLADGTPEHPLYIPDATDPVLYRSADIPFGRDDTEAQDP